MRASQPDSITKFIKSNELTFEIPVYQRNYVWKVKDCDKLFEDILHGILNNQRHYFGNIVYYEAEKDPFSGFTRYILIDGQQRITSTMLLLAAIRDEEDDLAKRSKLTSTYLTNDEAEENFRVKLKQVETDRDVYEAIIEGNPETIDKSSVIYRNYFKFRSLVKKAKQENQLDSAQIIQGLDCLDIIAIDLESSKHGSESPQVIFESINATGEPLSTADLIRNFLLLEVGIDKQEYYYKNYWLIIEKNIGNENISDYIRRYLILRRTEDIKKDTEYKEFKNSYYKDFNNAEEAIVELAKYSKYYKWIKNPETISEDHSETSKKLQDLDDLRMLPATPAIMWLLERADTNRLDFDDVNNTLDVIASWSFRARITNIISTGEIGTILTTKILELLKEKKNDDTYADYIWFELSNYRLHDIYPNDSLFKESFSKYDFYKNYRKYVQQKLEMYSRKQSNVNDKFYIELESIEHVLPQTLVSSKWPGITPGEHAEWVNTIGNLIPMNMKDNPAASNGSFSEKVPYLEKSVWHLAKDINKYDSWGIDTIKKRGIMLANNALNIWKGPAERTREIEVLKKSSINNRSTKFLEWIKEFDLPYLCLDEVHSSASYIRINSDYISTIIPNSNVDSGGWKSGQAYYYEIKCEPSGWTRLNLSFSSPGATKEQLTGMTKVMQFMNKFPPKETWQWFNVIGWTLNYDSGDEMLKEDLNRVLSEEIPRFERNLQEFIDKSSEQG